MTTISSFADLANTKLDSIEKPKPLPTGHYQAVMAGNFAEHKSQKGTLAARYPVRLIGPMPDVDASALEAAGGVKEDKTYTFDFYLTADSMWRVKEFAKSVYGVDDSAGLLDVLNTIGTSGQPFLVEGKQRQIKDSTDMVFFLDNPAPLESYKG